MKPTNGMHWGLTESNEASGHSLRLVQEDYAGFEFQIRSNIEVCVYESISLHA